jgi:hypothetical protein
MGAVSPDDSVGARDRPEPRKKLLRERWFLCLDQFQFWYT